jgi:hypothetical protein
VALVLIFVGFNAGLGASIELNYIPWVLSLALIVFVPASLGRTPPPPLLPASRGEQRAGGLLLAAMLTINTINLVAPDSLPTPLDRALHAVQWHQRWSMYVPPPPLLAFRLVFRGQTFRDALKQGLANVVELCQSQILQADSSLSSPPAKSAHWAKRGYPCEACSAPARASFS